MTALEEPFDPESVDRVLSALSTEANRQVVNYFREFSDDVVALDDLAGYVAENQDRPPEQVALRLHHGGLPKLADVGLLEYDSQRKQARSRSHPVFELDDVGEIVDVV